MNFVVFFFFVLVFIYLHFTPIYAENAVMRIESTGRNLIEKVVPFSKLFDLTASSFSFLVKSNLPNVIQRLAFFF